MVKGLSIKFKSYEETIPTLLKVIRFSEELKKHDRIILKPNLINGKSEDSTNPMFVEAVLRFIMENKNAGTEIFIAEGCDGVNTLDAFEKLGYKALAEKYGIGLIDFNNAETEEIEREGFLTFDSIQYPKMVLDSFLISLPRIREDWEIGVTGTADNMLGLYPAKHYKGILSRDKSKIKRYPIKHQIHDILKCKMPDFSIADASDKGMILAGQAIEIDQQAAKLYGFDAKDLPHLKLAMEVVPFKIGTSSDKDESK